MQRGARSFFHRSITMQRGTRFAIFVIPFGAPSWAQRGRRKHYKTNMFLIIFKMKGTPGAAIKWIPQNKNCKICPENQCFLRVPWELFGIHLGWSHFWARMPGVFQWGL